MFSEYDDTQAYNDLADCKKRIAKLEAETKRLLLDIDYRKALTSQLIEQRDAALAVVRQLRNMTQLIKAEPHGCPVCDSGKLRNPTKTHWNECGFAWIDDALTAAARVLGEKQK